MTSNPQKAFELLKQLSDQYNQTKDPTIGEKIILLVEREFIDIMHDFPREEENRAFSSFKFIGKRAMEKSIFRVYRELKKEREEFERYKENERLIRLYSLEAKSPSQIKAEEEAIEKRVHKAVVSEIGYLARSVALADETLGNMILSRPIIDEYGVDNLSSVSNFLEDIAHKVLWIAQCNSKGELTDSTIDSVDGYVKYLSNQLVSKKMTNQEWCLSSLSIDQKEQWIIRDKQMKMRNSRFELLDEILTERMRQITKHGYSESHDDEHTDGSIANASAHYASTNDDTGLWPWDTEYNKKSSKTRRDQLIASISMLIAEVERLDRLEITKNIQGDSHE
jgi:hypothetical protein